MTPPAPDDGHLLDEPEAVAADGDMGSQIEQPGEEEKAGPAADWAVDDGADPYAEAPKTPTMTLVDHLLMLEFSVYETVPHVTEWRDEEQEVPPHPAELVEWDDDPGTEQGEVAGPDLAQVDRGSATGTPATPPGWSGGVPWGAAAMDLDAGAPDEDERVPGRTTGVGRPPPRSSAQRPALALPAASAPPADRTWSEPADAASPEPETSEWVGPSPRTSSTEPVPAWDERPVSARPSAPAPRPGPAPQPAPPRLDVSPPPAMASTERTEPSTASPPPSLSPAPAPMPGPGAEPSGPEVSSMAGGRPADIAEQPVEQEQAKFGEPPLPAPPAAPSAPAAPAPPPAEEPPEGPPDLLSGTGAQPPAGAVTSDNPEVPLPEQVLRPPALLGRVIEAPATATPQPPTWHQAWQEAAHDAVADAPDPYDVEGALAEVAGDAGADGAAGPLPAAAWVDPAVAGRRPVTAPAPGRDSPEPAHRGGPAALWEAPELGDVGALPPTPGESERGDAGTHPWEPDDPVQGAPPAPQRSTTPEIAAELGPHGEAPPAPDRMQADEQDDPDVPPWDPPPAKDGEIFLRRGSPRGRL